MKSSFSMALVQTGMSRILIYAALGNDETAKQLSSNCLSWSKKSVQDHRYDVKMEMGWWLEDYGEI
jgi:3-methyladenine DNA glycosylase AlkD